MFSFRLWSQVSITNINVQAFNITPDALLNVGIMNSGNTLQVQLVTQLFSSKNVPLLTVRSAPFNLVSGLNPGLNSNRKVQGTEYASSDQANYLKTSHNLPSGRYKICASLILPGGADKVDDLCEELEAEFNQYLYLVNPFDGDTIESKNPILSWTHSEPFTILNQGEFYRMVVTEINKSQSPEDAINVNSPVMVKNYLKEHQVSYPYDARELKAGSRYAWQVQKMSDGVVINKTEAWVFVCRNISIKKSLKYVALKNELDGSFYSAYNGEVFFKFSEEYKSQGKLNFSLLDDKSKEVNIDANKDAEMYAAKTSDEAKLKMSGDNRYEMDLNAKKLKSGFYTLIVKNEKNESFYLKIFLP
jgi:hypothetical protein